MNGPQGERVQGIHLRIKPGSFKISSLAFPTKYKLTDSAYSISAPNYNDDKTLAHWIKRRTKFIIIWQ